MSFNRRKFLVGLGAGLLLPKDWDFYADYLARTGEPYLALCADTAHRLYVKDCGDSEGLRLLLDYPDHDSSVPDFSGITKRQFISRYLPGWTEEELAFEDGLDEIVPHWYAFEHWVDAHSPDTKAYELLEPLDLGRLSEQQDRDEGWVHFVNGPCPGNSGRWVTIDPLGASVLQHKLNETQQLVRVVLA